jgi:hypothetical protein
MKCFSLHYKISSIFLDDGCLIFPRELGYNLGVPSDLKKIFALVHMFNKFFEGTP